MANKLQPAASILLVDDDPDICENLKDILGEFGYDVHATTNPLAAIEMTQERGFDLTILDLKMPQMNGLELFERLKDLRNDTTAIIATAYAETKTARLALASGVSHLIHKPVDVNEIVGFIDQTFAQPIVLVIDDDHEFCESITDVLHATNHRVGTAGDIGQAATMIHGQNYDVFIIDMKLPDGSGEKAYQLVKQIDPQAKVILITGYRSEMDQQIASLMEQGALTFCYKPIDPEHLIDKIDEAAGKKAC